MTNANQDKLANECAELARLTGQALAWVEDPDNADTVGAEARSLRRSMRKTRRRAGRLGRAAGTRMSVSVFGPSQAGKSFLVSVLARPGTGPLVADYAPGNGQLDYIREINPEGEGESTGLVTRFTMEKRPTPDGHPVCLTLLSEADIIRTLVNSFFMDGDLSEPAPEPSDVAAHIEAFATRSGGTRAGLDQDDVYEIAEYIEATFGREAYAAALKPLWDDAAQIAPGLSPADRAAFFALLWGGHQPLSDLYARLAKSLGQLDHVEEVFCGLDALVPRDSSIIDVKTLAGAADGTPLSVLTPSDKSVSLPRSVVCALAAELVLPMRDLPAPMFAETDLLDFPGARNRFEQDLDKAFENPDPILPELLLRGKVAYLFDRYVEDQEITSMLLCIPDSNMETVDLPGLVQNWIAKTNGATPEQRKHADCVLFMVLTKFDKHLSDSAAEGGDETRFERRMQASLLEKFGKGSDPWIAEWQPGQPFDNCFWLRNPNFFVDGLIEYGPDRIEQHIRPEKEARLAELRAGCLRAPSVQRHFADPEAAWNAALTLNDGGVQYLATALERVCKPDAKLNQIRKQLETLLRQTERSIAPFHISDDLEQRIAEKKTAASAVIDDLEVALTRHRFGALMQALMVQQDDVEARISHVPSQVRISNAVTSAGGDPGAADRPQRPGRAPRPDQPTEPDAARFRTVGLEEFQAETALEVWIEGIKALRDNAARRDAYGLSDTGAFDLVAELIHAARRNGLSGRTATQLREVNFGLTVEKQAQPAAIIGAESINRFVGSLGMRELTEADRPLVEMANGQTRPVFAARPATDRIDDLPLTPRPVAEDTWTDWVFALEAVFIANAKDGIGDSINVDQNLRLGELLGAMKALHAA